MSGGVLPEALALQFGAPAVSLTVLRPAGPPAAGGGGAPASGASGPPPAAGPPLWSSLCGL